MFQKKREEEENELSFHFQICLFSYSLGVFLSFDAYNSFSRDVLVYFLRV